MEIAIPTLRKMADFGPEEPFAARIWLTFPDLVQHMEVDASYDDIVFAFSRVVEALSLARSHLTTIESEAFGSKPTIDQQKEYAGLYNALWSAYKDRFQAYLRLFGFDIGFMFVSDKAFETKAKEFTDAHPSKVALVKKAKAARGFWQQALADHRNNFHTGDRRAENAELESPEMARWMFDRIWQDIEDIFIFLGESKMKRPWVIREIPENERDAIIAKRFEPTLRIRKS